MSLDKLISKYLDSELSEAEDLELRKLIASDEACKQEFDDAVNLHLAIKEDANKIKVPADLLRETEDKILMEILKQPPLIISSAPLRERSYAGVYSLAATIAFFLFITIFKISDFNFNRFNASAVHENAKPAAAQTEEGNPVVTAESVTYINKERFAETKPMAFLTDAEAAAKEETALITEDAPVQAQISSVQQPSSETPVNRQTPAAVPEIKTQSDFKSGKSLEKSYNAFDRLPQQENALKPQGPAKLGAPYKNGFLDVNPVNLLSSGKKIEVSSNLGTDIYLGGIEKNKSKAISNFSQSIAYSVADKTKLGLEFGYSEFSYMERGEVKVPIGSNGAPKTEGYEPGNELKYYSVPVEFERQKQMYWASGIIDYNLISSNRFNLDSRLGAGFSAEGPLSYVRMIAKLRLVSSLYLTLGAEGKVFSSKTSMLGNDSKWKSSGGFIYGLQFGF